jgi:hypothetical protein
MIKAVKLYKTPLFLKGGLVRIVDPESHTHTTGSVLFKSLPTNFSYTGFSFVEHPEQSDFFIVPQPIKKLTQDIKTYLRSMQAQAQEHGVQLIIFLSGDHCHEIHIDMPGTIVFKASEYVHNMRDNEIIFAPFVEDLGEQRGITVRPKADKPSVGFCGYAGFPSLKTRLVYLIRNFLIDISALITRDGHRAVYKRGVYFRRKAMSALMRHPGIETQFIIRNSFSGNSNTLSENPEKLREEYVRNLIDSDFILAPKGDANYSSRFFEALSLGRIPVLIDTDMTLPLEHLLPYEKFVLRIPHTRIHEIGDCIAEHYSSISNIEFRDMQIAARKAFEEYLRYDAYFSKAFHILKEQGIAGFRH